MTFIRTFFLLVLPVVSATSFVHAQDNVITKPGSREAGMDFSRFAGRSPQGRTFSQKLQKNLTLHSLIREVPPSQAGYQLLGSVATQGGRFEVQVQVRNKQTGKSRYGKQYRVTEAQLATLARKIADEIVLAITGKPGFSQKRIAFIGTRPGQRGKEIFSSYPDGSGFVQLTRDQSVKLGLEWLPNASGLVYTSYHRGFPDIYRHTLKDGKRQVLSNSSGMNAGGAISPDGRKMAMILSKDGKPELYVKDLASGRLTRLTRTSMSAKSSPSWSPDGRSIVFTSSHQGPPHLYIIRNTGGSLRRVTRGGGENLSPDWGSNGQIVFTRRRAGKYQIAIIDPKGDGLRYISPMDADYEDPSWAADGLHVLVSRTIRGSSSLYLLDSGGKQAKALIPGQGSWYTPAWSK